MPTLTRRHLQRKKPGAYPLQSKWDLLVINPGLVLGPSLSQRKDSASVDLMISILKGKYALGMPNLQFAVADVRDVATAHILAAKSQAPAVVI